MERSTDDRSYWAAFILKRLKDIEQHLVKLGPGSDAETVRRTALHVLRQALILAADFHALTVIVNERPISVGTRTLQGLAERRATVNAARHVEASNKQKKWNDEARKIWARNPRLSRRDVATKLKSTLKLKEAVDTIRKRLKKPGMAC